MKDGNQDRNNIAEKERARAEIERQVEDFLRKGGQISVFDNQGSETRLEIGSVWHGQDDFRGLTD